MDEKSGGITILRDMKKIMHSVKKNMGCRFNAFNLTGPQGMLMQILNQHDEMKIGDVSKIMGLSNSTVSGIIDRLEKQELVERKRSDVDRRVVYVNVTPKFKQGFEENFKAIENDFEGVIEKCEPEEIETIIKGLGLLNKLIEKW